MTCGVGTNVGFEVYGKIPKHTHWYAPEFPTDFR
jgi:hypothetical protein